MSFEIDHIFICTSVGAPEADCLIKFGLTEGSPNVHSGQGTANRRFFFRNAMLELLWVSDAKEAQSETTRPTRLWERWTRQSNGACPFGFCFRPKDSGKQTPFAAWEYRPAYLPSPFCIQIAKNSDVLSEPMLVYLAFAQAVERHLAFERESNTHTVELNEITRVQLMTPRAESVSSELSAVTGSDLITLRNGKEFFLELGFDGEKQGRKSDFRPRLPLTFSW